MVSAYVLITVEPGRNQKVLAALRRIAGVKQAHVCWGTPDIFAFVEVANETALAKAVMTTIQGVPGVRTTETHPVVAV